MIRKISLAQQYKLPQQLNDEQSKIGERHNGIPLKQRITYMWMYTTMYDSSLLVISKTEERAVQPKC